MRRSIGPVGLLVLLGAGMATTGLCGSLPVQLGVRAGYADIDESPFSGADELGEMKLFGLQFLVPVHQRLTLGLEGEGSSESIDFTTDSAGEAVHGDVDWSDLALYGTIRLHILPPVAIAGLYVGGGAGVHFTETEFSELDDDLAGKLEDRYGKETTDVEWNALAGASVDLGKLLEIFSEARYRDVTGDFDRESWAGYAGLNLKLE